MKQGFDHLDRRLLATIAERFDGWPRRCGESCRCNWEDRNTIEDVLEPLIQQGCLVRTPRGRTTTQLALGPSAVSSKRFKSEQMSDKSADLSRHFLWPVRVYIEETLTRGHRFYANYLKLFGAYAYRDDAVPGL